jgi:hypothetical protein
MQENYCCHSVRIDEEGVLYGSELTPCRGGGMAGISAAVSDLFCYKWS